MLQCPPFQASRYKYLQGKTPYFFALNLRNSLEVLPQLLGSIIEAIRFLGPKHCTLSIVEGNSKDGTAEVLAVLQNLLPRLNIRVNFNLNNPIDPHAEKSLTGAERFSALAELRNLAIEPLFPTAGQVRSDAKDATVIFINDVLPCPDDFLELIHQRYHQEADMACAMDWTEGNPPAFYDTYVTRTMSGDLIFPINPISFYERKFDFLFGEPIGKARLERHVPLQVFSCWNGAVAFTAKPVVEGKVRFRASRENERGECRHSECQLLCKDLWWEGYGRIMMVPSVNVAYDLKTARAVRQIQGSTSSWVEKEKDDGWEDDKIKWLPPPDLVKCMPDFDQQTWRPWNETLL